ncbi:hypothetical protein OQA88_3314 [Cercophora sp. LCS_1]
MDDRHFSGVPAQTLRKWKQQLQTIPITDIQGQMVVHMVGDTKSSATIVYVLPHDTSVDLFEAYVDVNAPELRGLAVVTYEHISELYFSENDPRNTLVVLDAGLGYLSPAFIGLLAMLTDGKISAAEVRFRGLNLPPDREMLKWLESNVTATLRDFGVEVAGFPVGELTGMEVVDVESAMLRAWLHHLAHCVEEMKSGAAAVHCHILGRVDLHNEGWDIVDDGQGVCIRDSPFGFTTGCTKNGEIMNGQYVTTVSRAAFRRVLIALDPDDQDGNQPETFYLRNVNGEG